jgi:hypothetical protein
VLDDGVLVHVRLQRLEPRLVLLRANCLQLHKHANLVDDGRLAEPRQPIHGRLNGCFNRLGLLLLPGIGLSNGLFDAC